MAVRVRMVVMPMPIKEKIMHLVFFTYVYTFLARILSNLRVKSGKLFKEKELAFP
jgi:hypothetical protein